MRTRDRLVAASVVDAALEAEVLLRHAMGVGRAEFFAALGDPVPGIQQEGADRLVERRATGEPLAYIVGSREFYGLDFLVNSNVLVPRQETELLVDQLLEFYASRPAATAPVVADVGTGSGAIAVAIAVNLPGATVYATDSSRGALDVADANSRRHQVSNRVRLVHGDLLDALPGSVDAIVSNPPYLTTTELDGLEPELRREPATALDGGADGLHVLGRLIRRAPEYIRRGGLIAVEIAPGQLGDVMQMARARFPGANVVYAKDLLGLPRVVAVTVH